MSFDSISRLNGTVTVTKDSAPVLIQDIALGNSLIFTHDPPGGTSDAVVAANFIQVITDTTNGSHTGTSHAIGNFTYLTPIGPNSVQTVFGDEFRLGGNAATVGDFVCTTYVFDANSAVNGMTAANVILQQINDQPTVTWMTNIKIEWLDVRIVVELGGGIIITPLQKVDSYVTKAQDSGKTIEITKATGTNITILDTPGFECAIAQGGAGAITPVGAGSLVIVNRSSHTKTAGQNAMAFVRVVSATKAYLFGDTAV